VLGYLLNDCPVCLKLSGVIKPVGVYAEFETEIITNFLTKESVCINILT
jgi:hypothetical protein